MTVYFSHATSFCGGVWDPVRDSLGDIETVAWDHPGHGHGPGLELPVDWRRFGEYVLDVTEPGGLGVGHSMGAAALAMAQVSDPTRFRCLILIEPIVFPGPYRRDDRFEMTVTAAKRKADFESRDAAAENFRGREPFSEWDDRAFQAYLECGFIGDGPVRLACPPEIESDIYRAWKDHETWDELGSIEVPVLLMVGEHSDTVPPDFAREQAAQFPAAGLEIVEGTGHFLPMERPEIVANRVRRLYETTVAGGQGAKSPR
jgi:pimeloyl-ACP methyl ester carboxylesterase